MSIYQNFINPDNKYRGKPFWSWNGKLNKEELINMKFIRLHIDEEIPEAAEVEACFECKLEKINFTDKRRIGVGEITDKNKIWFEITIMCDYMEDVCNVPYTEALFETFREKWGYDLEEYLPELFLRRDGKKVSPVKWQYIETLQQMFLDNFAKPIHDWCKENNMKFTGYVLHEDTLSAQTILQDSLMRPYEHVDFPEVDVLAEYNTNYCTVKQLSSVAHQLGQKWLLSKLYGCEFMRKEYKNQDVRGAPYSYKLSETKVCVLDFDIIKLEYDF